MLKSKNILSPFFWILILLVWQSQRLMGQGPQTEFGQNRVQYHDFDWQYFETKNFTTYFYPGGQDLGKFTVQEAEKILPVVENLLDYKVLSPIEILVFNDVTDQNQSNIG